MTEPSTQPFRPFTLQDVTAIIEDMRDTFQINPGKERYVCIMHPRMAMSKRQLLDRARSKATSRERRSYRRFAKRGNPLFEGSYHTKTDLLGVTKYVGAGAPKM